MVAHVNARRLTAKHLNGHPVFTRLYLHPGFRGHLGVPTMDHRANGREGGACTCRPRTVRPLAETASVDDQAAWLDDATVAYTLRQADGRPDIWSVPADGTGAPRLLVPQAESPASLIPG